MKGAIARLIERLRPRPLALIGVAAARPLGQHVTVYVIDVDGRRSVFAAGPRAICLLSSYEAPAPANAAAAGPKSASV